MKKLVSTFILFSLFGSSPGHSQVLRSADQNALYDSTKEADIRVVVVSYLQSMADKNGHMFPVGLEADNTFREKDLEFRKRVWEKFVKIEVDEITFTKLLVEPATAFVFVTVKTAGTSADSGLTSSIFDSINRVILLKELNDRWTIVRHESLESHLAKSVLAVRTEPERLPILDSYQGLDVGVLVTSLLEYSRVLLDENEDYSSAGEVASLAKLVAQRSGRNELMKLVLPELGRSLLWAGDFGESLNVFQAALAIADETNDRSVAARVWLGMSLVYSELGDLGNAIATARKRLHYSESIGDKAGMVKSLINIGNFCSSRSDFICAMESQTRALKIVEEISKDDPAVLRSSMHSALLRSIGILYYRAGGLEQALEFYRRALSISEQAGRSDPGMLINIGNVHLSVGDDSGALENFAKAFELFEKTGHQGNIAAAANSIANVYRARGDYVRALQYHSKAYEIRSQSEGTSGLDGDRLKIAFAQYMLGDHTAALTVAEDIAGRQKDFDVIGSITANMLAGKIHYGKKDLSKSSKYLERALAIMEEVRGSMEETELPVWSFFDGRDTPHDQLIRLRIDQQRTRDALILSENAKSRALIDILIKGKLSIDPLLSDAERKKHSVLKIELTSLQGQLLREGRRATPEPLRMSRLQDELRSKRLEFEDFTSRLYLSHPRLRSQRGHFRPIDVDSIEELIPDNDVAIAEFAVLDDSTFVFLLSRDSRAALSVLVFPLTTSGTKLEAGVARFRSKLANGDLDFQKASRELYDLLLKPAEKELAGKTNIIIVPDGPLWDLPFQALMDEKGKYLVEKAAISYAPSLTALREMKKRAALRQPTPGAELLAFGNPIVAKGTKESVQRVFMDETLEPIPEAERLVNELAKMYGPNKSKVFTGSSARESVAKTEAPKYRIVQFATHGILNNISPMYSHLVMAQDEKDPNEDGLLEAWELKDLDLKADLVILTACETARGKISNGEGVIGMTWAAFIAGAPTTVASQWKVESSSTTELMLEFHRQLRNKKPISKAEALRRASLKIMKMPKYRHPSYWAGWVMVGDGS
jgi:CHAT domain-containing protein/TPR repeat protein